MICSRRTGPLCRASPTFLSPSAWRPPSVFSSSPWPLVTLLAFEAFGSFKHEVRGLAERDVRAVSVAGEVGQQVQSIGRLAAEHLYVYDGDPRAQDRIAAEIKRIAGRAERRTAELGTLIADDTFADGGARVA